MAKKKHRNHRAEQAHRKNEEERAYREKARRRKAFWDRNGKKILITAAAVIVALVLIKLAYSCFYGPGGSLPTIGGKIRGAGDNWIISDLSDNSTKKYFKLGEMEAPEGYTLDEDMSATSTLSQAFYYCADDESADIASVYVSGVANYTAEEQLARLIDYGYFAQTGGVKTATIDGVDVNYAYFIFDIGEEEDEEGAVTYASLCFYIDSVRNSSVLMMLNSQEGPMTDVLTEEEMMAAAEQFLPLLTVEK